MSPNTENQINLFTNKLSVFKNLNLRFFFPKVYDEMASSVDPNQTSPAVLGLHCLLRPVFLNI